MVAGIACQVSGEDLEIQRMWAVSLGKQGMWQSDFTKFERAGFIPSAITILRCSEV